MRHFGCLLFPSLYKRSGVQTSEQPDHVICGTILATHWPWDPWVQCLTCTCVHLIPIILKKLNDPPSAPFTCLLFPFLLCSSKWKSSVEETKAQSHGRCHWNHRKQQPWIYWKSHRMCLQTLSHSCFLSSQLWQVRGHSTFPLYTEPGTFLTN